MARWTLVAFLPNGTALSELTDASDRKITARLSDPSTIEWSMRGTDPAAAVIDELATDVIAYRDNVPVIRGRVGPSADDLSGDSHRVTFAAPDYRSLLGRRTVWAGSTNAYLSTDQATIAMDLIADSQALVGGNLGISQGATTLTGRLRDRAYEEGKSLGEAIDQLADVVDGFDWDIGVSLTFDLYYPRRGRPKDFVAHWGSTVTSLRRSVDPSGYANAVRVSGATGTTAVSSAVADLASRPEGRWEAQVGYTDVSNQSTVAEKAAYELAERSVIRPSYTATLRPGVWQGPGALWLGDECRLVVRSGRLDVNTTVRVHEVAVSADDDGNETVDVTFDRPRSSFVRRVTDAERQVVNLERR